MQSLLFFSACMLAMLSVSLGDIYTKDGRGSLDKLMYEQCKCTDPEDCNDNIICTFDFRRDECGRKICRKGPDEKCSEHKDCAQFMQCTPCEYCGGCAQLAHDKKTMLCHKKAYDCLRNPRDLYQVLSNYPLVTKSFGSLSNFKYV